MKNGIVTPARKAPNIKIIRLARRMSQDELAAELEVRLKKKYASSLFLT